MAKPQETYNKKEKEKKRIKKREEKQQKREERKNNSQGGDLESMITYIDEDGNFTDTPPDPTKKKKINAKNIEIGVPKREEEVVEAVKKGTVEFFNDSKGFGFIKEQLTQEKYFVHVNGLIDDIQEGNKVSFELERGMKGMNAVRVKKI
ncbi:cold shock domain-containing protein [Reichenbachiella agarivorans]|uniref:Cold shock domain-containing protein n=1 Tax=Reichenbachiella agarivorans TaxID=2979464 RepID=A0ABY6CL01_9BACT|nr:cold shock domain-containing protein [Reichenbachiella agarivorans]UXP31167.1 cold shock domain-containing protein [Reichenbachiella agarivorans]